MNAPGNDPVADPLQDALAELRPAAARIDSDRTLYDAGYAAGYAAGQTAIRSRPAAIAWPTAAVVSTAAALALWIQPSPTAEPVAEPVAKSVAKAANVPQVEAIDQNEPSLPIDVGWDLSGRLAVRPGFVRETADLPAANNPTATPPTSARDLLNQLLIETSRGDSV